MIRRSSLLSLGLISLLPLIAGCTRTAQQVDDNVPPFVFRSLNLRQQDKQGRPTWELTSPEARYDVRRRLARAIDPRGVIYKDGEPAYALEASSGTVINDGEVILMEGSIRLRQLGKNPLLIKATRLRWYPSEELMRIDRNPEALDRQNRILADKARFLLDKQQLELRGKPELQRWSKRVDPLKDQSRPVPELVIKASRADWQPNTGLLDVRGPLNATRRPAAGSPPDQKPMTVTASALDGNTIKQEFVLKGPVNLLDPAESTTLRASRLRIDVKNNRIRSDQAFSGNRGDLLVRGQSLVVDGDNTTVRIPSGCEIDRPGERLRAQSCSWNWKTQAVTAQGSIGLRREANQQITRGERLSGRLGKDGQLEITAPGGRVFSQFKVPQRSGPAKPRRPRPKPEPIRL